MAKTGVDSQGLIIPSANYQVANTWLCDCIWETTYGCTRTEIRVYVASLLDNKATHIPFLFSHGQNN